MRLKHVLFSSLFLSAAFVACTNEELIDVQTPSVDVADAISLGEGFTISGAKVAIEPGTKSFFEEETTGINTYWEETDILGAAWYSAVNAILPDGYVSGENGTPNGVEKANVNHNFAWNADFNFKEFAGTDKSAAYFEAKTNLSAGAYVVYYPWNESVAQVFDAIPVTLKFPYTVNLAEGHEYDAVSDNMFSYGVAAFVPGGRQTDKFYTKQVPVLYGLRLGADHLKLVDLDDMQTIDKIVIEAYKETSTNVFETVLTTAGKVTPPATTTAKNYNDYIDFIAAGTGSWDKNPLPKATYESLENDIYGNKAAVNHYTIDLANSNQSKYQISTVKDQLTDLIIFSSLPTLDEATKLVVKVITTEGLNLTKTFDKKRGTTEEKAAAAEVLAKFNKAQNEGAMVQLDVFVDTQSDDEIIYTADQFKTQWAEAIASDEAKTLTVADPVILEDIVLENTNPDANVTIKLDDTEVNAALTLKGIDIQRGALTIKDCPVIVDGDINSSANLNINGTVTAKNIILNSNSNKMNVAAMESLEVRESGKVTLVLPAADYLASGIGNITVFNGGQLTVESGYMNGAVEVKNGGNFSITGSVTNLGSFNGKVSTSGATAKFINAEDATATLAARSNAVIENQEGATLNINGTMTIAAASTNAGVINIADGEINLSKLTQNTPEARVNVAEAAEITGNCSTISNGWVVIKDVASISGFGTCNRVAYSVESATDFTQKNGVDAYFINADVKLQGSWSNGNLYFYADQTIIADVTISNQVYVVGDVKFSTVDVEKPVTYTQNSGEVYIDGSLYLNEGVNFVGKVEKNSIRHLDAYDYDAQVTLQ